MINWGRGPSDTLKRLQALWERKRTALLMREVSFPLRFSLKPPSQKQAEADLAHFQRYISDWQSHQENTHTFRVEWTDKHYSKLGTHRVPSHAYVDSNQHLFTLLGKEIREKSHRWATLIQPYLSICPNSKRTLIAQLDVLDKFSAGTHERLRYLLGTLKPNIAQGLYVRQLVFPGIDTKFIETHERLLFSLLQHCYPDSTNEHDTLFDWLGCTPIPKGWLGVRPLCPKTQQRMMGMPRMQLDQDTLMQHALPATNILIVENHTSGFALPQLSDTIAIYGLGSNTKWTRAHWLKNKNVGYWGDLDLAGLRFLANVKKNIPHLTPLMMDREAWQMHEHQQVRAETRDNNMEMPVGLTIPERELYHTLQSSPTNNRLEQERLDSEYIEKRIKEWHQHSQASGKKTALS